MVQREIANREDVILLVDSFYEKVQQDNLIGFIFNDIARVDWSHHLPIMYNFWESLLLDSHNYGRNAMEPHFRLNKLIPLEPAFFDRWLELFEATVHELFTGTKASLAITRARSIKGIMALKMDRINHPAASNNGDIPVVPGK
ncbi:group III truncated hemoglobin [Chitinophaga nivalis]|uniref:Group III truncated hemoglobin n=1 Tax=Chitinophaga nivalis TaxID=2991709 RepID=A0ABT3ITY7_9BACT|nr:group III truncated hemoglobin [Chitinophaga nivalis]MCW3462925.1 group III truncated hemoglobin [Chitinophaga nivalis]MCW3487385.1 group III truncated hemoglobin [Chitinophaga nivalis]